MKIPLEELKTLTLRALRNQGYNEDETAAISEILPYAQLRGNDQGVVKLIGKGMPRDSAAGEIMAVKETPQPIRRMLSQGCCGDKQMSGIRRSGNREQAAA